MFSGYYGGLSSFMITFIMVLASFPYSLQGGFDVSISITQQPRLQMSVGFPLSVFLMISGAIQYGPTILVEIALFSRMVSFFCSKFLMIFFEAPKSESLMIYLNIRMNINLPPYYRRVHLRTWDLCARFHFDANTWDPLASASCIS